jgi:PAS domain S-box-containing protein
LALPGFSSAQSTNDAARSAGLREQGKKTVLMLFDERFDLPGLQLIDKSIEAGLTSRFGNGIEFYRESLDLSRFPMNDDGLFYRDYYRSKYAGKRIDAVLAIMEPALTFTLKHGNDIFPGAPIVFCGVEARQLQNRPLGPNVTGVYVKRDFAQTAELALTVWPHTHQAIFIAGTSAYDRALTELARADLHLLGDRVAVSYLTDLPVAELLERVSKLPHDSVILYSSLFIDGAGESFDPYEVASLISRRASVPCFGFTNRYVGRGIVGGKVVGLEAQGAKVAEITARILRGNKAGDIGVMEAGPSVPTFDWRQVVRWKINPVSLPANSIVRFHTPSLWERHRWTIMALAAVVIAQSVVIIILMINRRLRQRAEARLSESETRFGRVADAAPVMIWMSGPDKLCTFFNKAWLEFTGRTMEQELGKGWTDGVHPDDLQDCLKTYVHWFEARESFFMEYRLRRRDGEYRHITDTGVPRYGSKGNFRGYIGACVDITDTVEKERALRESEERMSLAVGAANLELWEWDFKKDDVWGSKNRRALLGLPLSGKLTLATVLSQVHVDDRERVRQTLMDAIETGEDYTCEYRILIPGQRERWTELRGHSGHASDGKTIVLRGVAMDITERKQAQDLFRLATEASPSGTVLVNDQGRIILVNAHVEELFGYRRDELIGKPVEILVAERFAAEYPAHRAKFHELPEARMMGAERELFARRKDGTEFPVEVGLNPIQTGAGLLVLASVIDVSARRLAEQQARQSRDEISRLSRISLLGEMTASIAHELNQPLAAISSNASAGRRFIDRDAVDVTTFREILVDIEDQAHRANDVIRNIRNTVKKGDTLRERINLNDLIRRVGHMLQPDARAHSCKLDISLPNDLPTIIQGDPLQIQQVLVNLVGNGFEAMVDTPPGKRTVEIAAERNGDGIVCVSVRDQGVGVSDEARERLFDQFFTTKEEGLGMGLAIVRSVIEAHGGKIEVENLAEAGARFYFTLPISQV